MKFPNKKYKLIYADPPWPYTSDPKSKRGIWGLADQKYNIMTIEDLKNLPVKNIADDNCILFMWGTWPTIFEMKPLMKSWGFEYKTCAFVWRKLSKNTITVKKYGLGWYTRSNSEFVLIGRKGKFNRVSAAVQQFVDTIQENNNECEVVDSPIKKHSQKPNEIRERIRKLCGDLPKIELFARTRVHGWDVWGNDEKLGNQPLEAFVN